MEAIGGTPQSDPSETENEADIALAGARVAHEKQSNDNAEAQKPDPKEAERNTEAAGISAAAIAVMVPGYSSPIRRLRCRHPPVITGFVEVENSLGKARRLTEPGSLTLSL